MYTVWFLVCLRHLDEEYEHKSKTLWLMLNLYKYNKSEHHYSMHAWLDPDVCFTLFSWWDLMIQWINQLCSMWMLKCLVMFVYVQDQYKCFCGNSYGRYGQASNCSLQCVPRTMYFCGGPSSNTIYTTGLSMWSAFLYYYLLQDSIGQSTNGRHQIGVFWIMIKTKQSMSAWRWWA